METVVDDEAPGRVSNSAVALKAMLEVPEASGSSGCLDDPTLGRRAHDGYTPFIGRVVVAVPPTSTEGKAR